MIAAIAHFFSVVACCLGITADVLVWWIFSKSLSNARPSAFSVAEICTKFLAAFSCVVYGFQTSQPALFVCSLSAAVALSVLSMSQYRALRMFEVSGVHSTTTFHQSSLVGLGSIIAAAAFTGVMTFMYTDRSGSGVAFSGASCILFSAATIFPAVSRAIWPQSPVVPVSGDALVIFFRGVSAAVWMCYAVAAADNYILGSQFGVGVSCALVLVVNALGLRLPQLANVATADKRIWGDEPPYTETTEDKASLFATLFFSWVEPFASAAADEKLSASDLPPPMKELRAWSLARKLSAQFQSELDMRDAWKDLIDVATLQASWDACSRGTLRWVGVNQRSPTPDALYAGVEWSVKPKRSPLLSNWADEYHNGTYEGELLFQQASASSDDSSCIPVEHVVFVTSLPPATCVTPVPPSIVRAVFAATWNHIWVQAPFRVIADLCMLSSPLILEAFVKFLESDDPSFQHGAAIVMGIFFIMAVQSSLLHRYYHLSIRAGIVQKDALLGVLFEKCLLIAPKELAHPTMGAGRVVNMVGSDAERFNDFQQMLLFFWSYPFQVVCGIALLYRLVGWCAVGSILALTVAIPLQKKVASLQQKYRQELVTQTDQRVKLTNELFSGIRIVKYMGWEKNFLERVEEKRSRELHFLKRAQYCRVLSALVTASTPTMLVATVFVLYYLSGHTLSPAVVFPTISVLNLLRIPFMMIPMLFSTYIQFSVAASRITKFLMCDNQSESSVQSLRKYCEGDAASCPPEYSAILDNATISAHLPMKLPVIERQLDDDRLIASCKRSLCRAESKGKVFTTKGKEVFTMTSKVLLRNVSIAIPRGKLTVIVGPTGCGKSTLLDCLLGQLEISAGSAMAESSIAYVPQQPWIMNATVRNNIIFFSEPDEARLRDALRSCQLGVDMDALPAGLETEIGEKGVNLSGGQRARVSMARAVYAQKEMYLLDDPLSALDAHVGAALFEECILKKLAGTTRILATHHIHVLHQADYVIELSSTGDIVYAGIVQQYSKQHEGVLPTTPTSKSEVRDNALSGANADSPKGKLMTIEEKASGSVSLATYFKYLESCGGAAVGVTVLGVFLVTEFLVVSNTVWLSLWSVKSFGLSQSTYLIIYLGIITVGIVSAPLRFFVAYEAMRTGSRALHSVLLKSVVRAPMAFFDTTPLGRVLNRFVQDIDQCDNGLQLSVVSVLQMGFSALSTTIIMLSSQPIALVVLVPCLLVYYRLLVFYNAANREARRIGNIVKSPVFSLLTEVLSGARTIRAFQTSKPIMMSGLQRIDVTYSAAYLQNVLNRWLGVRIEFLGNVIVSTVALASVVGKLWGFGTSNVAVLSLGLTMSTTITTMLNWMVRQVSTVESDMNSIERILHYSDSIEHEPLDLDGKVDDTTTGSGGSIEYRQVCMRYREGLPLVLNNLSFEISAGERVGVVGRTGSGKSSLLLTFLRIVDISSGCVLVDGIPASTLKLHHLRKLFAMIPQDPILFDGTVRSNLDPFSEHTDDSIRRALTLVGLAEKIFTDHLGILQVILDGGVNFSVGQRQLLCMARAILKRGCKFVLMDEATANIDPALDRLIQTAIKTAFEGKTVITIAHRLHTVASYDKILVMDEGRVAESGSPRQLYELHGIFRSMIDSHQETARAEIVSAIFTNN